MSADKATANDAAIIADICAGQCAITIKNPKRRNAMTLTMWQDLAQQVSRAEANPNVHLITLRGYNGTFVSGADISEFDAVRGTVEKAIAYEELNGATFAALRSAQTPTLALIEGFCFGGGVGLAAACDLRMASSTAKFCIPAAKLGLAYPVAGVGDLVRLIGPAQTKHLFFTARTLEATEAQQIGFVEQMVEAEQFEQRVEEYTQTILSRAPLTQRATNAAIAATYDEALLESATRAGHACFASKDYEEGRASFLEKRQPRFEGG